jgi:phosphonate transport system substrate-binding protein
LPPLRVVSFLAPNILPLYQYIAGVLGEKTGLGAALLTADSHDEFAALQPDVAFICGLPYVLYRRQPTPPVDLLAAPVLLGGRYGGRPIYFSDVITRPDAPFHSLADLRGQRWAYNEAVSQSGYGITRARLVEMGETKGFFSQVVCAGWHQRAVEMVIRGEVDATAIDSQVLAVELRDHPTLRDQIKVIDVLGPSTIQPVVARADLDLALKARLREIFLTLGDNPAARPHLAQGLVERFVPAQDADYDDIRAMLTAAEAADFLTLH